MPASKKVVLHCPNGMTANLDALVDGFVKDGVTFVAVVGKDCERVEDAVDELLVGDGSGEYSILTSSHPGETVEHAVAFARSLTGEYTGDVVKVVELLP